MSSWTTSHWRPFSTTPPARQLQDLKGYGCVYSHIKLQLFTSQEQTNQPIGGARMAQWREVLPPTNVALVQFPDPASYVGCCWFSPCSERFFSGYSRFPLSSKTNISKFQFDPESRIYFHFFTSPHNDPKQSHTPSHLQELMAMSTLCAICRYPSKGQ